MTDHSGLTSEWICVSCEGKTIDGRIIESDWLIGMADSYDPNLYTALIWEEHDRNKPNLGEVLALKYEYVGKQIRLYARIKPTLKLIEYNRNGQKLFCSVEVEENFAQSGKFYLGGLAVTDSPASMNTDRLRFKNRNHYSRPNSKPVISMPLALERMEFNFRTTKGWVSAITSG
ncbi:MAG: GPO family capsid scaffolding protein [Pantoea sp.]|uniref:GPO family capsid scaffolding protein n=1 Tax=Pantoea sp. TaxID=69393 RepID=UPI0039E49100